MDRTAGADDLCIVGPGGAFGLGERPVQRGHRGMLARVLAGLDAEFARNLGDGDAAIPQCAGEQRRVVVDDLGPSAVVALGDRGLPTLQGLLAAVVAIELGGDGEDDEDGEEHGTHAVGVVDAGERTGAEFELHAGGLEPAGDRCP
ncbi:hypothetical protein [Streptomyces sp. NPDC026659]|uniref:hypothetical protein n=1 Tax=Streptomyces sp. NPDC026659 TaxID=3155123 RepID=UPI0033DC77AF